MALYPDPMPLHLMKLCVGVASIGDLEAEIAGRLHLLRIAGLPPEQIHTTRMVPKRMTDMAEVGSLYWVIKGQLCARQALTAIRPICDADGIGRCQLVLDATVIPVLPRPCRPFQGWRYLDDAACPPDLAGGLAGAASMPEHLRHALRELCLL